MKKLTVTMLTASIMFLAGGAMAVDSPPSVTVAAPVANVQAAVRSSAGDMPGENVYLTALSPSGAEIDIFHPDSAISPYGHTEIVLQFSPTSVGTKISARQYAWPSGYTTGPARYEVTRNNRKRLMALIKSIGDAATMMQAQNDTVNSLQGDIGKLRAIEKRGENNISHIHQGAPTSTSTIEPSKLSVASNERVTMYGASRAEIEKAINGDIKIGETVRNITDHSVDVYAVNNPTHERNVKSVIYHYTFNPDAPRQPLSLSIFVVKKDGDKVITHKSIG